MGRFARGKVEVEEEKKEKRFISISQRFVRKRGLVKKSEGAPPCKVSCRSGRVIECERRTNLSFIFFFKKENSSQHSPFTEAALLSTIFLKEKKKQVS